MIGREVTINRPIRTPPGEKQQFEKVLTIGARIRQVSEDERIQAEFKSTEEGAVFSVLKTPGSLAIKRGWQVVHDSLKYIIYRVDNTARRELFARTYT